MATGNKVLATVTVKDGKPVVDLGDNRYKVVTTQDGVVCIVEVKKQEYCAID